jgi:regulatory protein
MADESELTIVLPAVISSISIQKKNKERYSLFADDEFLLGVAEQTLLKFNLTKGVEITPSLFRKLQREEGRFAVKSYFLNLLSRRDHARKELLDKARKKDYPTEVIENVLDELEEKKFINDRNFAKKYASEKYRLKKWGPLKIQSYLYKKGVSKKIAHQSIEKVFKNERLDETFLTLVLTRKNRFLKEDDPFKRKKKVFDNLARRGYYASDIYKHLDELMKEIES